MVFCFFFSFWSVLPSLIRSAAHHGLDGDGLPENLQPLPALSPFSCWNHNGASAGATAPGANTRGGGRNNPPTAPRCFQKVWEVPPPRASVTTAVPTLGDNSSAHFSCAFLRNSFVQAGCWRSIGNRSHFGESIDPLRSPGPISQKSALSLPFPLGNARWKRQGCAQDISTNLLLEKNNPLEPCAMSPSRKNYVQEGK